MSNKFIDASGSTNVQNGVEAGLVDKGLLIDLYPGLNPQLKQAILTFMGRNDYGQGGQGVPITLQTTIISTPMQTIAGGNNWKQIDISSSASHGIKSDGTLWGWGYNSFGDLGTNSITHFSSPVQVVGAATTWKQVAGGFHGAMAIKTDGTLWGWGYNSFGNLGNNTLTHRSSPAQVTGGGTTWKKVVLNKDVNGPVSMALKTDGTLWVWGNTYVGDNSLFTGQTGLFNSSPAQVSGLTGYWKDIAAGGSHRIALNTNGDLFFFGLLNNGVSLNVASFRGVASAIQYEPKFVKIYAGNNVSAGIKDDGTLWLWGANYNHQLGINGTINGIYSSPVQIAGGGKWKKVAFVAGNYGVALKNDGTMWGWGNLSNYGNATGGTYSTPIQLLNGNNWKDIATGSENLDTNILFLSDVGDLG